mmetsp:Transcript_14155/g.44269  ORF Transcript_14155/g.44269 Transcript_14155/m.44269 type:complete len:202 (-) Transcript_14155:433-1038(-)
MARCRSLRCARWEPRQFGSMAGEWAQATTTPCSYITATALCLAHITSSWCSIRGACALGMMRWMPTGRAPGASYSRARARCPRYWVAALLRTLRRRWVQRTRQRPSMARWVSTGTRRRRARGCWRIHTSRRSSHAGSARVTRPTSWARSWSGRARSACAWSVAAQWMAQLCTDRALSLSQRTRATLSYSGTWTASSMTAST